MLFSTFEIQVQQDIDEGHLAMDFFLTIKLQAYKGMYRYE